MTTDILDWSCSAFTPPWISRSTPHPRSCVKSFFLSHDDSLFVLSVHPPAEVSPQLNPLTESFPLWSVLRKLWFRTCFDSEQQLLSLCEYQLQRWSSWHLASRSPSDGALCQMTSLVISWLGTGEGGGGCRSADDAGCWKKGSCYGCLSKECHAVRFPVLDSKARRPNDVPLTHFCIWEH